MVVRVAFEWVTVERSLTGRFDLPLTVLLSISDAELCKNVHAVDDSMFLSLSTFWLTIFSDQTVDLAVNRQPRNIKPSRTHDRWWWFNREVARTRLATTPNVVASSGRPAGNRSVTRRIFSLASESEERSCVTSRIGWVENTHGLPRKRLQNWFLE